MGTVPGEGRCVHGGSARGQQRPPCVPVYCPIWTLAHNYPVKPMKPGLTATVLSVLPEHLAAVTEIGDRNVCWKFWVGLGFVALQSYKHQHQMIILYG